MVIWNWFDVQHIRSSPYHHLRARDVSHSVHHRYGSRSHLSRMYDRGVKGIPSRPAESLHYRIETLVGVTGFKMAKYRATWGEAISAPFKLFWRPHLLSIMVFEVLLHSLH